MQEKVKVYHFHNGSGGGVLSVIKNLVRFADRNRFENHIIYTVNKDKRHSFSIPEVINSSQQIFYYSSRWNFYYTCKKLSELIPDENVVIVANDWLELGMVSNLGLNNPVIQILHGDYDYYYKLSLKHNTCLGAYVTVAQVIADKLRKQLPARFNDIHYLPFPVPAITPKNYLKIDAPLQIVFIGRLTKEKGYDLLPLIDNALRAKRINVRWHIVGEVKTSQKLIWNANSRIQFHGELANEKVIELMQQMDCLVLPSLAEGMPVTVVEAMKVGLTCLTNDLPGGLQELIINGVTGYRIKENEVAGYVDVLEKLRDNPSLLCEIGKSARASALTHFDPVINTSAYENLIIQQSSRKTSNRKALKVYGSRLDNKWIPNSVTTYFRKIKR